MENYLVNLKIQLSEKSPLYTPLYIRVKVLADSPRTEIVDQMEDETYKIRVAAKPLKGKANEELCKFLKKNLAAREVVVVTGGREKVKLIRISL